MPFTCEPPALEQFVARIFEHAGADADIASEVARHLIRANLSGHDSHGVIRVAQYMTQIETGEVVPSARPVMMQETAATALVDARRSFGLYSTMFALDWGMEHAAQTGVAAVAVRHSAHIGRVGEYSEKAGERGLATLITVGAAGPGVGGMVPFGGAKRFLGANPWSMGVPVREGFPLVFDGSTSTIAEGKVRVARAKGTALPAGCIMDAQGRMTTQPDDFYAGGALVPLGGAVAGHKGYGLAMISALLGGLSMIDDADPTLIGAQIHEDVKDPRGRVAGVFLIVIDPQFFGDPQHYKELVSETVSAARRVPPAAGVERVLMPGELEVATRERRSRDGLELPDPVWRDLQAIAGRFGIEMPVCREK